MSDYDVNIYYHPEKLGLTEVAEIDWSSGSYEFDYRVVWKDANGILYTARDSGCSCPSPFEDYDGIESLDRLDITVLEAECREKGGRNNRAMAEAADFLTKVKAVSKACEVHVLDQLLVKARGF